MFAQDHLAGTRALHGGAALANANIGLSNDSSWDRHWQDNPARVRACKQVRDSGHQEEWIMATCDTLGKVTITPNVRVCRHKSMPVARGLAIVKPDEPLLVKLCIFGKD